MPDKKCAERIAFERWARANGLDTHMARDGDYMDAQTAAAWFTWQARAALSPALGVNTHDELVAALQYAERFIAGAMPHFVRDREEAVEDALPYIRATLAKAGAASGVDAAPKAVDGGM